MSWATLANNQMVSFTDAQGGGFSLNSGQSHVNSNQLMTKLDALTKYNLVASNMSSYVDNQLVPKSAWVNGLGAMWTINSYTNPNLYFTRNYGSDSSVTVQTSTNSGSTWANSTGPVTSPRNIGSLAVGTWIRLQSISNSSLSNIIVVEAAANIFSANLTVGTNANITYGYVNGSWGSITSNTMTIGGRATTMRVLDCDSRYNLISLFLDNGSSTIEPVEWGTITIAGFVYSRSNFILDEVIGTEWRYYYSGAPQNPMGTVVGAVKTVTIK